MSLAALAPESALDNRRLLAALRAFRRGDFSVRLPDDLTGLDGELAEAFNDVVELNDRMSREFGRLGEVVGRQGKINNRARVPGATGHAIRPLGRELIARHHGSGRSPCRPLGFALCR